MSEKVTINKARELARQAIEALDAMQAEEQADQHGPTSFSIRDWKPDYTLNRNVDLARLGEQVLTAFELFHEAAQDGPMREGLADTLCTMRDMLYPGASRMMTHEEYDAMTRRDAFEMVDRALVDAAEKSPRPELVEDFILEARGRLLTLLRKGH